MLLLMPPAEVTEAVSPVALNVWTRDSAASNRVQPAGFLSGTTRNSMGVPVAAVACVDACGVDACCEHPAMTTLAMASAKNVPVKLRICRLPFQCCLHTSYRNGTCTAWHPVPSSDLGSQSLPT